MKTFQLQISQFFCNQSKVTENLRLQMLPLTLKILSVMVEDKPCRNLCNSYLSHSKLTQVKVGLTPLIVLHFLTLSTVLKKCELTFSTIYFHVVKVKQLKKSFGKVLHFFCSFISKSFFRVRLTKYDIITITGCSDVIQERK